MYWIINGKVGVFKRTKFQQQLVMRAKRLREESLVAQAQGGTTGAGQEQGQGQTRVEIPTFTPKQDLVLPKRQQYLRSSIEAQLPRFGRYLELKLSDDLIGTRAVTGVVLGRKETLIALTPVDLLVMDRRSFNQTAGELFQRFRAEF